MITINREIASDYYARFLNPVDNTKNIYVKYLPCVIGRERIAKLQQMASLAQQHRGANLFQSLNLSLDIQNKRELTMIRSIMQGEKVLHKLVLSESTNVEKNHFILKYNSDSNYFEICALYPMVVGKNNIKFQDGFKQINHCDSIQFPAPSKQEMSTVFYFSLPFAPQSLKDPLHSGIEQRRDPDWKLTNEWQNVERQALKKYLLSFGYGRWQKFREVSAYSGNYLLKKSDKEMQIFSNSLIRAVLEYIPHQKAEVKLELVSMMKEERGDAFVSIKPKEWGAQIKQRAPAWAKRLILLFRIDALMQCYHKKRQLFFEVLEIDKSKSTEEKDLLRAICRNYENLLAFLPSSQFYGQRPAAWWSKRHDVDLIVGTFRHGYANYSEMRRDPSFSFSLEATGGYGRNKSKVYQEFPNADTITRRLKKLVSMLGKYLPQFKELDLSLIPQPNYEQPTGFSLEEKQAIVKVLMLYGTPVTPDGKLDYQDLKVRANQLLSTPIDNMKNMSQMERFVQRLRMLAHELDRGEEILDLGDELFDEEGGIERMEQSKGLTHFDPDNDGFHLNQRQIRAINRNIPMLQYIRRRILTQNCKLFNSKVKSIEQELGSASCVNKDQQVPWKDCLPQDWQVNIHDRTLLLGIAKYGMSFCDEFAAILENDRYFTQEMLALLDSDTVRSRIEYLFDFIKNNAYTQLTSNLTPRKALTNALSQSLGASIPRKVKKDFHVQRDDQGNIIFPIHVNSSLRLLNLGEIQYERKTFHSQRNLFPVGFKSIREHQSVMKMGERSEYLCEIEDGGTKPTFKVTPMEDPEHPIIKDSSTGCWIEICKKINILNGQKRQQVTISGPQRFGLSDTNVIRLLQTLPNTDKCKKYQPR